LRGLAAASRARGLASRDGSAQRCGVEEEIMIRADLSRRWRARPGDAWRRCAAALAVAAALAIGERGAFAVTGGGNGGYESEQGQDIFGTRDPGLEGAKIPVVPARPTTYQQIRVDTGQLHAQKAGGDVAGAAVVGLDLVATRTSGADLGKPVTLHIAAARPHINIYSHVASDQVWEYDIQVVDGGKSSPLCDNARNAALAVPGLWNGGASSAFDQWIAFACVPVEAPDPSTAAKHVTLQKAATYTKAQRAAVGLPIDEIEGPRWGGGAAAKCIDYGYAPWTAGSTALGKTTRTQHKVASSVDAARQFHNLCTRAMTADYEAHGTSHTIAGTLIRIFDLTNLPVDDCTGVGLPTHCKLVPPSQPTAPPQQIQQVEDVQLSIQLFQRAELVAPQYSELTYESVWHIDDGIARASCLAKVRWQTIDAIEIANLRWSPAKKHPTDKNWQYCDARSIGSFRRHDTQPMLFVYSAINEKGLYRFRISSKPVRYLTTTRVEAIDKGIALAPGLPCEAPPCLAEKFEGDVLSPDEPTDAFKAWKTVPLFLMRNSAGDFATVARVGKGDDPKLPDGYHLAEIGPAGAAAAKPVEATTATAKATDKATARPSVAPKVSAGAVGPTTWTALPEGYLFDAAPELPGAERFGVTDAKASLLHWFHQGERYCTALDACGGFAGAGHGLGYVLLPAKTLRRAIPTPVTRPGEADPELDHRAQPDARAPAPVAKPAETAPH
jgi:hypothetical protein